MAGDDLRHLDWRAYARTDQLLVRLYREEILPRVEILLDVSRSMAVDAGKAALALDLAALLAWTARAQGMQVRLLSLTETPGELELARLEAEGLAFEQTIPLAEATQRAARLLRPGALRYLVSDFLSPCDPRALVRSLAARAGRLVLLQVLAPADAHPPANVALRLTDAETGEALDLVLEPRAVERYRARLRRLVDGLQEESRRAAGGFLSLVAGGELATHCRDRLVPAGVLEAR